MNRLLAFAFCVSVVLAARTVEPSNSWTVGDLHMPSEANVSRVRCLIVAAAFANGKVWNARTTPSKTKPQR